MFYNPTMHRSFSIPPRLSHLLVIGAVTLGLAGCTTVSTKQINARKALKQHGDGLTWKKIEQSADTSAAATRTATKGPISKTEATKLRGWAGSDPARLKEVAALYIREGEDLQKNNDSAASGYFLAAAEFSYRSLLHSTNPAVDWPRVHPERERLETYNYAITRLIETHPRVHGDWPRKVAIETPAGTYQVGESQPVFGSRELGTYDEVVPANQLRIKGFSNRTLKPGIGARLVGVRKPSPERTWELAFHTSHGINEPLTALITFPKEESASQEVTFWLLDTTAREVVPTPRGELPLATDFTSPIALMLDGLSDRLLGLAGIFNVGKQLEKAGTYMVGPYEPDKIPVLMVHGLQSSPLIWRDMIDEMMQTPEIRKNYQFWLYYYPTGLTIGESSTKLRSNIREIREHFDPEGKDRASQHMVVFGHSMGGVLSRMLVTDVGDRMWNEIANKPFSEVHLSGEDHERVKNLVFWDVDPAIERAVFFSAPHRGANMADNIIGKIGRSLVRLPKSVMSFHHLIFDENRDILKADVFTSGRLTGISSLSPNGPLYRGLEKSPFSPYITYHSIIGDRGKGDTPDSSDGVVEYWSSHLEGAASELIVPTGHTSYTSPLAVEEAERILLLNLER